MPVDEEPNDGKESVDPVVGSVIERVRHDFPRVSELAVESHLTFLRANAVYGETLNHLYEQLGLSRSRFNLLWVLYRSEGRRLSIGGLADHMGIKAPTVMRMVQTLDSETWVRTRKGTTDRRVTFAELTEEGELRFAQLLRQALHLWEDVWSELTDDEKSNLVRVLARLRASLLRRYLGESGLAAFRARQHDGNSE
jgi:MarR family 2-MHQ and catechol resistance regulon transcriptional repressor